MSRGALVAMKFAAAVSPTRRRSDEMVDLGDLSHVVEQAFSAEDEETALRVAEAQVPGAREELSRLLDDLRHDRPIEL